MQVLDHLSAAELRRKYADHGVQLDNIEEVDFVWSGQPLTELIGKRGCYDWIIASHVVEHVPDLISFLQQCSDLLKAEGRLSLVIPDKRYCFDYFNATTTTGALLDAFELKRTPPTPGQVFDYIADSAKRAEAIAWNALETAPCELVHGMDLAQEMWRQARTEHGYIDVHCWRLTPARFQLILSDLNMLGLIHLNVVSQFDTDGCEFYVTLGKEAAMQPLDRLAQLRQMEIESSKA